MRIVLTLEAASMEELRDVLSKPLLERETCRCGTMTVDVDTGPTDLSEEKGISADHSSLDAAQTPAGEPPHEALPESQKRRGRPRKATATSEPAVETPAVESTEMQAVKPAEKPAVDHAAVRAALIRYAGMTSNAAAKALLPEGVASVKECTPEQCADVLARVSALISEAAK